MLALAEEKISLEVAAGGSGANSMIGISQLGGRSAFSGKIGRDEHGKLYREKLEGPPGFVIVLPKEKVPQAAA
ncbi:MAG: hypothetical protein Ct9H300mP28_05540 [Pseudomonadota bacterium]|nr:MAG: hypothetical protein Ct9H300mP28_05540 [Pseudomonadota bacterium]